MSEPQEFAEILLRISQSSRHSYIQFSPEILDHTCRQQTPFSLQVSGSNTSAQIDITSNNLPLISKLLQGTVLQKDHIAVCWNWKNFQTWHLARTGRDFVSEASIADLKVLELYAGLTSRLPPASTGEALRRLKQLVESGAWADSQEAYRQVLSPLINLVVPHMETAGVLNLDSQHTVFPYYELCGQANGRFLCSGAYTHGFNPHILGPKEREIIVPRTQEEFFLYFDYQNMEAAVLPWLTQDEQLLQFVSQPGDFYSNLYQKVIGKPCMSPEQRKKSKKFFLPVIYGQQAQALSHSLSVPLPTAEQIIMRLQQAFPDTFSWISNTVESVEDYASDPFGKRRYFDKDDPDKSRKIRNFLIQSPASLICLSYLVRLYLELCDVTAIPYHVHDGFVVYAKKKNWKDIFLASRKALTQENDLFPGLNLRVSCSGGRNLNNLKPVGK